MDRDAAQRYAGAGRREEIEVEDDTKRPPH
jgi:hypothetical protein